MSYKRPTVAELREAKAEAEFWRNQAKRAHEGAERWREEARKNEKVCQTYFDELMRARDELPPASPTRLFIDSKEWG